jgi:hypothetical protein
MQSGARAVSTGATIATVADRASLAFAGVALGTKLGKFIDSTIYATNPNWWDEHYPTINPETWDDMATTEGGKNFIRSVFGLQNDDTTMYLDERMLAYTYMMLLKNGAYATNEYIDYSGVDKSILHNPNYSGNLYPTTYIKTKQPGTSWYREITADPGVIMFVSQRTPTSDYDVYAVSKTPGKLHTNNAGDRSLQRNQYHGIVYYTDSSGFYLPYSYINTAPPPSTNGDVWDMAYLTFHGKTIKPIPGIGNNPQAGQQINPSTLINPTTGQPVTPNDNPADVLQALKTQYPELFNDPIYEDVPQEDGTIQRIIYIPVPYPDTREEDKPTTDPTPGVNPQTNPQVNPNNRTDELIQQLIETLTTEPTPPDTGDGDTPPAVIPVGSANALYSIYNPTQAELNSFGGWLWSSDFVDQLLKLFNDPMQAIIGLHKVFATPATSGTSTIKVGYLDSGVSANVVSNQYTTVDCGSVNVSEYFGNVFDYDPYTQVYIYLPFIGIEKLNTGDVMRGRLGVKYRVDVLTGACLAEITVTRDGAGGILYTFAGNCAVQYPISSGSYMGIVASLASIAGGVVGTVASGGALAPITMGAVNGIMNAHTRVNHSGAFSGNAGAMGVKKPYLIIVRPQTCLADNFQVFDGYPANKTTKLSNCTGFVKCEAVHVENVPATDNELTEIESLLKSGIII